jgi:hypothetical protein
MKIDDVRCLTCHKSSRSSRKSTFLGFKKYTCAHCGQNFVLNLRPGYRVFYLFGSVIMVLMFIGLLLQGTFPIPGFLGVATIWSLIVDSDKRRQIGILERDHARSIDRES